MNSSSIHFRTRWLAILLGLLTGCDADPDAARAIGYVEVEWHYVAAPQSGWIVNRPAREGLRVSAGDLLFELEHDKEAAALHEAEYRVSQAEAESRNQQSGAREPELARLEAQLDEARAQLERAAAERVRVRPLVERGVEPSYRGELVEANYRAAQAAVSAAEKAITIARLPQRENMIEAGAAAVAATQAAREVAQLRLEDRRIRAGTSGRIEDVFYRAGEFARAGEPVVAILPDDGLYVHFFVPERDLSSIDLGDRVQVSADGLEQTLEAEVTRISTRAEFTPPVIYSNEVRDKLVFLVEARLSPGVPVHPGLPVNVDW